MLYLKEVKLYSLLWNEFSNENKFDFRKLFLKNVN